LKNYSSTKFTQCPPKVNSGSGIFFSLLSMNIAYYRPLPKTLNLTPTELMRNPGVGLTPTATGLAGGRRTGQGIKHYIEPDGRFARVFHEMPSDYLWPFRPEAFSGKKRARYSEKEMYRCPGCEAKVWGKGGLGLICECGKAFVDSKGESKDGLIEKVCRVLLEECGL
jgi:hypothetical protein